MNEISSAARPYLLTLLCSCWMLSTAEAYHPQSPEVQAMVQKAVRFLNREESYTERERVLAALALLKAGEPESNPIIQAARQDCLEWCQSESMIKAAIPSIYRLAVVGLFLCELDANQYESQIELLIKDLESRQKPFGGWGYPPPSTDAATGDTSMTQYAILFAWKARALQAAELPTTSIRKVTNWLLRTQDPSGAWGYQGKDPGSFRRVPQTEVRHSLAAAGIGSLYICSGMLGLTSDEIGEISADDELPPALKRVSYDSGASAPARVADDVIDGNVLRDGMKLGNRWFSKNYRINPREYTMYYLYTLERYQSFRDAAEGHSKREPGWYNDGVRFLRQAQGRRGEWDIAGGNGSVVDTSFGILFLVRSTQKSLAKVDEAFGGLLVAGRGIPSTKGNLKMEKGQIVSTAFQNSTSTLLEILESDDQPDFDTLENAKISVARDPQALAVQLKRMRRLVRAESFGVRLVAVRTLAQVHDLDNVPALIYALSDPDLRVAIKARDGLRFISRKFTGFGMPSDPTAAERKRAIEDWKNWYHDIRPHSRLED